MHVYGNENIFTELLAIPSSPSEWLSLSLLPQVALTPLQGSSRIAAWPLPFPSHRHAPRGSLGGLSTLVLQGVKRGLLAQKLVTTGDFPLGRARGRQGWPGEQLGMMDGEVLASPCVQCYTHLRQFCLSFWGSLGVCFPERSFRLGLWAWIFVGLGYFQCLCFSTGRFVINYRQAHAMR